MKLLNKAILFATKAHGEQVRKYTGDPYITHCIGVMEIIRQNASEYTNDMLIAAILHDVVEDTPVTIQDITKEFGGHIGELVGWLTDVSCPKDGNRAVRKGLDREHIAKAPKEAKTVKLADLIHNAKDICKHDKDFGRIFLKEKELLLEVLKDGDSKLWDVAYRTLKECKIAIAKGEYQ